MRNHLFASAIRLVATGLLMLPLFSRAQTANSVTVDADGTAHVTRVLPLPLSLSPEAQAMLRNTKEGKAQPLAERRLGTDKWQTGAGEKSRQIYPVNIKDAVVAGVPVREVTPLVDEHKDWVLICLHGGGFNSDSGSFTESIPMANLVKTRVVSVLYRLAPEHPFPAGLDDAVAVYKELLKTYKPRHIAIYGTSAGAILTAEVAVKLKQLGLPQPAALGVFSGMGDFTRYGDSEAMYSLQGLRGELEVPTGKPLDGEYLGSHDPKDPVVSPVFADLHGMPPTLFLTSGRDLLLSGTTILHRAYLQAGVDARLIVFEGLPHAFWNDVELPETKETYGYMAGFFLQQLSK
jgi:monoterpene epsilon-lactone hydrolase